MQAQRDATVLLLFADDGEPFSCISGFRSERGETAATRCAVDVMLSPLHLQERRADMFIGHFALGFAAKKLSPRTNLAVLMAAPLFLDIVLPPLLLLGVERMRIDPGNTAVMPIALDHVPWSHSLLMTFVWSAMYAAAVYAGTKDRRAAAVCAALVASHWVLDVITHRPDMQLLPWLPTRLGLGLWNSVPGTLAVELLMWVAAFVLYLRVTRARSAVGHFGPYVFTVVVTVIYLANVFGPPPPSVEVFAGVAFAALLIIPFIWWFDSRRVPATAPSAQVATRPL